jgi:hypothetical protein
LNGELSAAELVKDGFFDQAAGTGESGGYGIAELFA